MNPYAVTASVLRDLPVRALALASFLLWFPLAGAAQEAAADESKPVAEKTDAADTPADSKVVELPSFRVSEERESKSLNAAEATATGRIKTSILDTPQAISVITSELIKRVAPVKAFDVVAYTAGVSEGTSAGYFGNRVSFRGFPAFNSAFVDGISGTNFEMPQVERIEVLKGPNSVLAPTGLPGGTMNVVTKSPLFKRSNTLALTLGQFDAQRVTLDMTGPFTVNGSDSKAFAYRFIASYQDTERFQRESRREQRIFLPSITWKTPTTSATLKWNYYWSNPTHESRHPIFWNVGSNQEAVPYAGIARDAYFSEPVLKRFSYTNQPSLTISSQLAQHLATRLFMVYSEDIIDHQTYTDNIAAALGGAVNPRTGLYTPGFTYGAGPDFAVVAAPVPDLTNVARNGTGINQHTRRAIVQNDFVSVFNLPRNSKSTSIAGWSYTRNSLWERDFFGTASSVNLLSPRLGGPITLTGPTTDRRNYTNTVNAFALERLELFSGRLHLSGGLQWLRDRNKGLNQLNGSVLYTDVHTTTKLYSALWKLNEVTALYYSYNENAAPVSSGLAAAPVIFQAGVQDEVGVKWEPMQRRLRISAAVYKIKQDNFQFTNPARITDPSAPPTLFTDLKSSGWELEVSGAITKNLNVMGNYSYANIRDPWDRPQRGAAKHSSAFYTSYRWTEGRYKNLVAGLGVVYQGRRSGDNATGFTALGVPIQPTFYLAPYTVAKANLDYTRGKVDFQLAIDNLFDRTYIQSALTRNGVFMGSSRNIQFTTTVHF